MKNSNNCKVLGLIDVKTLDQRQDRSKSIRKAEHNRKRKQRAHAEFRAGTNPFQGLVIK